jgi:septal ring factor EnvC (AmiA/AmiB activator)
VQSQQIQQLFRQLADRDTELLDAEARAEAAEQDRDDFRRAVTELEIRVRQLEERSADREELFAKALDLGVEHGVPGRDWPLESRAGGLATLFSRTTKRRSA